MACPNCGSSTVAYQKIAYMTNMAFFECPLCGFHWMGGLPCEKLDPHEVELQRQYHVVYWLHAFVVWTIATLLHYFVACAHPVDTILLMTMHDFLPVAAWVLVVPIALSRGILLTFVVAQTCFRGSRVAIIALPLILTGAIGGIQGGVMVVIERMIPNLGLTLQSDTFAVVLGTFLGLLATPIIIVRSRNMLIRRGGREESAVQGDTRWRL